MKPESPPRMKLSTDEVVERGLEEAVDVGGILEQAL